MGRAESPIVAHSPGQRPGWSYSAINTFGIFALAQKCHAPRARNSRRQCHGALPLIMKAALTERDTLINALRFPRALPWAMGNNWAFSPPHIFQPATKYLSDRPNCSFETSIAPLSPVTANAITGDFFRFPLQFFPVCYDIFHFLGDIFCYKLYNMCYKLCNVYYKLCNIYSRLLNKKYLRR